MIYHDLSNIFKYNIPTATVQTRLKRWCRTRSMGDAVAEVRALHNALEASGEAAEEAQQAAAALAGKNGGIDTVAVTWNGRKQVCTIMFPIYLNILFWR